VWIHWFQGFIPIYDELASVGCRIAELRDQALLEEVEAYKGLLFTGMNPDFLDVDWLAVKLGDVNGDWKP